MNKLRPYTRGNDRRNCRTDHRADLLSAVYTRGDCRGDRLIAATVDRRSLEQLSLQPVAAIVQSL